MNKLGEYLITSKDFDKILQTLLKEKVVDKVVSAEIKKDWQIITPKAVDKAGDIKDFPLSQFLVFNYDRQDTAANFLRTKLNGARTEKIAIIGRPCDQRAIVELAKRLQVKTENLFLILAEDVGTVSGKDFGKYAKDANIDVNAITKATLTPETAYHCPGGMWFGGRIYHCWRHQGHGTVALHDAIVRSCDVYFYSVGQKLGVDRIAKWANQLGLGLKSGIELDNVKPGTIPSSAWKQKRYRERWYPAETLSVAIGQGYVATTPLQMAQVAAQVANGGTRYRPQFVKLVEGLDGGVAKAYPPVIENQIKIDPEALEVVKSAMADVVNGPGGTASGTATRSTRSPAASGSASRRSRA